MERKNAVKVIKLCISVFLICVLSVMFFLYTPTQRVFAEEKAYSDVLDDLSKDSSFSADNYPENTGDYSVQVIQLAESEDNELFVYAYQPSGKEKDFSASSINISTTVNDEISYYNYKLERLSSNGTLYKYIVKDFTIKSDNTRYYAISSIYRPFDKDIDTQAGGDNTITEVNYDVSKQWCFSTINGKPYVSVVEIETITITDKFVGFVRYSDGFKLYVGSCDSHFVAFNTDRNIDNLLEADVYYTKQSYYWSSVTFKGETETFGEKEDGYAYLKYTDKVTHTGDGWFAGTYSWDRIETVEEFIEENDLKKNVYSGAVLSVNKANEITDEGTEELKSKKWVLRFAETAYTLSGGSGYTYESSTLVGNVTILRLKFETDGITYNLGTIDNKQTGSGTPINEEKTEIGFSEWIQTLIEYLKKLTETLKKWFLVIMAVLLIIVIGIFFPPLLKGIIFIASLPFKAVAGVVKGIAGLFKGTDGGKDKSRNKNKNKDKK